MKRSCVVFFILAMVSITTVNSEPPNPFDVNPSERPVESQCTEKESIDKGKLAVALQQLGPNTGMQAVLDILGNFVNQAVRSCSRSIIPIDDFESELGKSYICGGGGTLNHLYSFSPVSWVLLGDNSIGKDTNSPLEFKVTFRNKEKATLDFSKTYVTLHMAQDIAGVSSVEVNDINVYLTVTTNPLTEMVEKLGKQECFLHIKHFESSLSIMGNTFYFSEQREKNERNKHKISTIMNSGVGEIGEGLKKKIKAGFFEALFISGGLCLDDEVKEVLFKQPMTTRRQISSEKFKKYCDK